MQDRRRVSGTIGASRAEQRPLSHLQLAHFTWNPTAADLSPSTLLQRHASGDWGDLDAHDRAANRAALCDGSRLLSAYTVAQGVKIWIITEAADEDGHRAATTLLLPEEY